jgi:hypothetical protein
MPLVPCVVYVERITSRAAEYGYLVAVYGPFPSENRAAAWIPVLKQEHPRFADDTAYWIGVRPLRDPAIP